ncbi:MAG: hypothetical protein IPM79_35025 [Polyangiaceae bacterium]|nr:hypothetical protein [Polyangiaceae bacterium]
MADEGQKPTVAGDVWASISEFYPYGDHPPRLAAGINDTPTNVRSVAQFAKIKNTHTPLNKKKADAEGKEYEVPQRDVFDKAAIADGSAIVEITEWIEKRLKGETLFDMFDSAWLSQLGPLAKWSPTMSAEDQWAMKLAELFMGVTYAGIGPVHGFGGPQKRGPTGELGPTPAKAFRGSEYTLWEPFVFSRFEKQRNLYEGEAYDIASWQEPVPPGVTKTEPNNDPAIPISVACQHMSTYAVLSRGFPLASMGNWTTPCTALMASDSCKDLVLFKPKKSESEKYVHKGTGISWDGARGKYLTPTQDLLKVEKAIAEGMGPGSIVTYDPDHGATLKETVWMTPYELKKHGPDPVKIFGAFYKSRSTVEGTGVTFSKDWTVANRKSELLSDIADKQAALALAESKPNKLPKDDKQIEQLKMDIAALEAQKGTDDISKRTAVPSPGGKQYDGSHIYAVLRVSPDKTSVQLMDVNSKGNLGALKETNSETIIARQGGEGIIDGGVEWKSLYNDSNGFAGIGVLPEHTVTMAEVAHMKRARPVGLARLVLTNRVPGEQKGGPAQLQASDVLYVSKMFRMYGDGPEENHYVSHLLWSLRNSPGFTNVQPWFCVFVPLGLLAKCMWAHGARSMTLGDFVARHRPGGSLLKGDYDFNIVLTNEGLAPRAGLVALHARARTRPEGQKTVREWKPLEPPGPIMSKVNPAWVENQKPPQSLAWNQSYVSPDIKLDETKLPKRFSGGG